ncbi:MAG TPA: hypothetical protein VKF63_00885 [Terracidiphilus sp.]|nr:hypothetical protein [Terracidiphilus sp.]
MKKTGTILMLAIAVIFAVFLVGCGAGGGGTTTDPTSTSALTFQINDACNDGYTVFYKFFDETDSLVWPSSTQAYTIQYGETYTSNLSCNTGAKICYGASDDGNDAIGYWGVGSSNLESCTNCCYTCANTQVDVQLDCGASPQARPDDSGVHHLERRPESPSDLAPTSVGGDKSPNGVVEGATCPVGEHK